MSFAIISFLIKYERFYLCALYILIYQGNEGDNFKGQLT